MSTHGEPRSALARRPRTFEELARLGDAELDVATGAALIAKDAYGNVDVDALLLKVARLVEPLGPGALEGKSAELLAAHVHGTLGFHGNEEDYHDPRNSLLSDVLERRVGIPISLALVYTEVARHLGVRARGVAFPGHYLVRVDDKANPTARDEPAAIVDPFSGKLLTWEAVEQLLRRTLGEKAKLSPIHLVPASPRGTLVRMLTNLKVVHLARRDLARAHLALDRILCLTPASTSALRERAVLSVRLGATQSARADFERVLELEPEAQDAPILKQHLARLSASRKDLN
jgi:regulator of sirC expression with transglutaminase-like and TPR domain